MYYVKLSRAENAGARSKQRKREVLRTGRAPHLEWSCHLRVSKPGALPRVVCGGSGSICIK